MSLYLILAEVVGVLLAFGLVRRWQALQAFKSALPYIAVLGIALTTLIVSAFPWSLLLDDLATLRILRSTVPTLAEEGAKVVLALTLLSSSKSRVTLPATALATGVLVGILESALISSRCSPSSASLVQNLCIFTVLLRPLGQCLLTYCTVIAAAQCRWFILALIVLFHLAVNLAGFFTLYLPGKLIDSATLGFVLDAGRQVIMFVVAGLIAMWLRRIAIRKAAS